MMFMLGLLACTSPEPPPETVRPVRVAEGVAAGGSLEGVFAGTTRAGDEATLSFLGGGTLEALYVEVGDEVDTGDVLARLDASQQRLQVGSATAGVAQAEAAFTYAEQALQRTERLFIAGSATSSDLERARVEHRSREAQLTSARQQRSLAAEQLALTELRANRSGVITQVVGRVGETVGAGRPVVVLTPEQRLEVEIGVPATWVGRLVPGDVAQVRVGDHTLEAVVQTIGGAGASGVFPVTVQLLAEELRPGMVVKVALRAPALEQAGVEVPLTALVEDSQGTGVWVVEELAGGQGRVRRQAVDAIALVGTGEAVVRGLDAGVLVVTAGTNLLYEGRAVRVGER